MWRFVTEKVLSLKDRIALYEHQAAILEAVAKKYSEGSPEYAAIRQAAIALWYALSQPNGDFMVYLDKWNNGELTPEEAARLKAMGIDPDSIDET
jgi:hypothetical protein